MLKLPFKAEQFLEVFSTYNLAIWPAQLVAYALGFSVIWLVFKNRFSTTAIVNMILALFWFWMGTVYHIAFFSEINTAAYLFGVLFIIQGAAFITLIWTKSDIRYTCRSDSYGVIGGLLILYAMIIYPILGYLLGHRYPQSPVFGVAPCPTTIFTFGILLWTTGKVPYWLLAIPVLWSLIGFSAALKLTIYEDTGLIVAGILGVSMLIYRNQRIKKQTAPGT